MICVVRNLVFISEKLTTRGIHKYISLMDSTIRWKQKKS